MRANDYGLPGRIVEYSNAVGRYGPDSEQTRAVRAKYQHDTQFLEYADSLDRIKRHLGGSGMNDR